MIGSNAAKPTDPVPDLRAEDRAAIAQLPTRARSGIPRRAVALVLVLIAAFFVQSVVRNQAMQWNVIGQYLFDSRILSGVVRTIEITFYSLILGFVLGLIVAVLRLSTSPTLRAIGWLWVWFFRAMPVLVLLIVVDNIALLYPRIGFGVPFGPTFWSSDLRSSIPAFGVAVLAFAANEAANASEIFRASIKSIHRAQWEAATALGMRHARIYRRIIIPQAAQVAIPPLTNDSINMMKNTSLVSFLAIPDLLYTAQSIYSQTYAVFPMLVVVSIWYVAMVSVLTVLQSLIEQRFDKTARAPRSGRRFMRGMQND
jgi:polar amino acid transport system permease protein